MATFCLGIGAQYTSNNKGSATKNIVVRLSKPEATTATVTLTLTGAASHVEGQFTPTDANYSGTTHYAGAGTDYTISGTGVGTFTNTSWNTTTCVLTFPAGTIERTATLTFRNNGVLQLDRIIEAELSQPSTGNRLSYPRKVRVKLVDPNIPTVSGVRNIIRANDPNKDYDTGDAVARGLTALVTTADTNNATNFTAMVTWLQDNGGGILYFPDGTYEMVLGSVSMKTTGKGVSIIGQSKTGTMLKRYMPTYDAGYGPITVNGGSGYPIFQTASGITTPEESAPLHIANLTVDGHDYPNGLRVTCNTGVIDGDTINFHRMEEYITFTYFGQYYTFKTTPSGTHAGTVGDPFQVLLGATAAATSTNLATEMALHGWTIQRYDTTHFYALWLTDPYMYSWPAQGTTITGSKISVLNFEMSHQIMFGNETAATFGAIYRCSAENLHFQNTLATDAIDNLMNTIVSHSWLTDDGSIGRARGIMSYTGTNGSFTIANSNLSHLQWERATTPGSDGTNPVYTVKYYAYNNTFNTFCGYNNKDGIVDVGNETYFEKNIFTTDYELHLSYQNAATTKPSIFVDCVFNNHSGSGLGIETMNDTLFSGCTFLCQGGSYSGYCRAVGIEPASAPTAKTTMTFDGCTFGFGAGVVGTKIGIGLASTIPADKLSIVVTDCIFTGTDSCVGYAYGGYGAEWVLGPNNIYVGAVGNWAGTVANPTRYKINGTGCTFGATRFMNIQICEAPGEFYCKNVALTKAQNVFYGGGTWKLRWGANVEVGSLDGSNVPCAGVMRTITDPNNLSPVNGTDTGLFSSSVDGGSSAYDVWTGNGTHQCTNMANKTWS